MTAVRQSFVFGIETSFGQGLGAGLGWIAPPPGSFFNSTQNRAVSRVQGTGSKMWDTVAYGVITGQWEWTFTLDYDYLEPLYLVFEKTSRDSDANSNVTFSFEKSDVKKVPSFVVRRKILNHDIGGNIDINSSECTDLCGCVCKSFRFSKNESNSQINVTMTGMYVDEKMVIGTLDTTDFKAYDGQLTEYMCMYTKESSTDTEEYVANTDSLAISIENNIGPVYATCSPIVKNYYEGITNYTFSTSCYSNNPDRYKLRLYGGGKKWWGTRTSNLRTYQPMLKGLKPIYEIILHSYDGMSGSDDDGSSSGTIEARHTTTYKKLDVTISSCVIKSLTWPKGNGNMLQDTISSSECKSIKLEFWRAQSVADDIYFDPANATNDPKNKISASNTPTWTGDSVSEDSDETEETESS